jgi:hypothetical protein
MPLLVVAVNSNADDNYLELKGIMITFCVMTEFDK